MGCHNLRIEVAVVVMPEGAVIASWERARHAEEQDGGEEVSGRVEEQKYFDA